jgi:hypothetical protein
MVQRCNGARLPLEAANAIGVGSQIVREYLNRDFPAKARVARAIHLSHAAGAKRDINDIRTEGRAGTKRHSCA